MNPPAQRPNHQPIYDRKLKLPGSELVTDLFGYWPTFHDADVRRIALEATVPFADGPELLATLYAFEMTSEVAADGCYIRRHEVLVTLRFRGVDQLELRDFNNQNAIAGLTIEDITERQLDSIKFEVAFDGSYGVSGSFVCREAIVEDVRPWTRDAAATSKPPKRHRS